MAMDQKELEAQAKLLELKEMPFHSSGELGEGVVIYRVAGGWIYKFREDLAMAAVFVPEPKDE